MTPWQEVGVACGIVLSVSCLVAVVWLCFVVAELQDRVDLIDDRTTPSFREKPVKPAPVLGPKTVEDHKKAASVPPPVRQFTGTDGKIHAFTFEGML